MVSDGKGHHDRSLIPQGKTMAEPQETQQEKETRWAAQRAAHETQQKDYRAARATDQGEKLVGGGSYRDHRGGDCCDHSAVKSGWRDVRCGHTEERGSSFVHGRHPESGGQKQQRPSLRMAVAHSARTELLLTSATGWAHDVVHAASLR